MKKLVTLFAFALVAFTANAQSTLKGDVNGDGEVNVTDVTMVVEHVLGQPNSGFIVANADVNGDGDITVTDVAEAVNIILDGNGGSGSGIGDTSQAYLTCPNSNHPHLINLGLPSGTKWACCNVGATTPEGYGGYYAWGETETKDNYFWGIYQYGDVVKKGYDWHYYGEDLGSDIAGTGYDVAHVKWGGSWVMPSLDQMLELLINCTYTWTTVNGVSGGQFTGPMGGTIFLPATGYRQDVYLRHAGLGGYYWCSTQNSSDSYYEYGYSLICSSGTATWYAGYDYSRCDGLTVRPVSK